MGTVYVFSFQISEEKILEFVIKKIGEGQF
jgi:hypothetical protein